MSKIREEVLRANDQYAKSFGDRSKLALPPARQFSILTCMDARIDPAKLAGLREGDAHVIRNAGGRASDDAIRSLVISYKLLGTREWFVIHHSNCGMELFNDQIIRGLLSSSLETLQLRRQDLEGSGARQGLRARRVHRLADNPKPSQERGDRRRAHQDSRARAEEHSRLRLRLSSRDRKARRNSGSDRDRPRCVSLGTGFRARSPVGAARLGRSRPPQSRLKSSAFLLRNSSSDRIPFWCKPLSRSSVAKISSCVCEPPFPKFCCGWL